MGSSAARCSENLESAIEDRQLGTFTFFPQLPRESRLLISEHTWPTSAHWIHNVLSLTTLRSQTFRLQRRYHSTPSGFSFEGIERRSICEGHGRKTVARNSEYHSSSCLLRVSDEHSEGLWASSPFIYSQLVHYRVTSLTSSISLHYIRSLGTSSPQCSWKIWFCRKYSL